MDQHNKGQRVIDLIVEAGLVGVDVESARMLGSGEADGVVWVWSANSAEQIGAMIDDMMAEEAERAVSSRVPKPHRVGRLTDREQSDDPDLIDASPPKWVDLSVICDIDDEISVQFSRSSTGEAKPSMAKFGARTLFGERLSWFLEVDPVWCSGSEEARKLNTKYPCILPYSKAKEKYDAQLAFMRIEHKRLLSAWRALALEGERK